MALSAADLHGIVEAIRTLREFIESDGELQPVRYDLAHKLHPSDSGRMVEVSADIEECELGPSVREALRELWEFVISSFGMTRAMRHKRMALDFLERIEAVLRPGQPDWICTAAGFYFRGNLKPLNQGPLRLLEAFLRVEGHCLTSTEILRASTEFGTERRAEAYIYDLNEKLRGILELSESPIQRIRVGYYQFIPPGH
jgi:hypothetical protein